MLLNTGLVGVSVRAFPQFEGVAHFESGLAFKATPRHPYGLLLGAELTAVSGT